MTGGTFTSYNKVRPGAYFNFKSVPRPLMQVGDRGIATIPIELNWGATGELIELFSDELLNGESIAKVGFTAFDEESKLVNLMLQYCYKVLLYRTNTAGAKATKTVGELTATAKYSGTFGNNIIISIVENDELFDVNTFVNGALKDTQTVATVQELENNDFVDFSGTGNLEANAGITLTGGTNGTTPTKATYYPLYLALLETANYQTMAAPDLTDEDATLKANVTTFIKNQRDGEGRYVQGVVANYPQADFEGIISVKNGVVINGVNFSKEEMSAVFAAMTAGAAVNESNTNKVVNGATDLIGKYTNSQIIDAIKGGELVFTANSRGQIKVETDINSYHTFIPEKNKAFAKNRVIRVFDEIGTTGKDTWEQSYMGKVDNDEDGRSVYRSDLISYLKDTLQNQLGAIQNFEDDDIEVIGRTEDTNTNLDLDVVIVNAWIMPVDSMEKLYFTCNVIG